ncbi:hypothetical protein COLO4_20925 [Corchorus olitorius]|uniref:Uncharacterized protein n=1 Tax=Corchorus olitorius TaxID=93759 RepID=A0A1R3IW40_9ROSI|nr:hypothetical protein COLO4_20925 [Corchorus olitorius]
MGEIGRLLTGLGESGLCLSGPLRANRSREAASVDYAQYRTASYN